MPPVSDRVAPPSGTLMRIIFDAFFSLRVFVCIVCLFFPAPQPLRLAACVAPVTWNRLVGFAKSSHSRIESPWESLIVRCANNAPRRCLGESFSLDGWIRCGVAASTVYLLGTMMAGASSPSAYVPDWYCHVCASCPGAFVLPPADPHGYPQPLSRKQHIMLRSPPAPR